MKSLIIVIIAISISFYYIDKDIETEKVNNRDYQFDIRKDTIYLYNKDKFLGKYKYKHE